MNQWKMNSVDFKRLLEDVQDFKCALTGLPLLPENVEIAYKIPPPRGKIAASNVYLVHKSIIKLAREYSSEEILTLARLVVATHG